MEVEEATRSDLSCLIAMKHVCKFCHKRFPCGRSLGGHMRSHLIANPSDHETPPKDKIKKKKRNQLTSPPTAADAAAASGDPSPIKSCKECGKGFHSSKALSGHMKSHAVEREKEKQREKESSLLGDDDDDQIVESEKSPNQQVIDRESDNEATAGAAISCRRPRRSNRRQRYTNGGSSSVPEIDQLEQEEVAMCLIMLSRDVGPWGELSDNNSVINWVGKGNGCQESTCEGSIPDRFLSNLGKIQSVLVQPDFVSSAMSEMETSKRKAQFEALELGESDKRSKFECTTCNKAFHSYQALGGHRASHKKAKGGSPSKGDSNDEMAAVSAPKRARAGQVAQKHECPICFKEFPSGQALGGHKRSHLMAASSLEAAKFVSTVVVEKSNATTLTATTTATTTTTTTTATTSSHEVRDFLDLNLPAPVEEEASNGPHHHQQQQLDLVGFKPWWVGTTHKHEQLVGLI